MIVWLLACTPDGVSGTLVDVHTGLGLSGLRVEARPVSGRCDVLTGDVVDGAFTLPKPCRGDYEVSVDDPARTVLREAGPLREALALRAWGVPASATGGVFLVAGGATSEVPAIARQRELNLLGKPEIVRFPDVLPADWPLADGWVVVVGTDLVGFDAALEPLVDAPERRFGSLAQPQVVPAWHYLGVALPADGQAEPVDDVLGDGCLSDAGSGRLIAGCPVSAISPGGDYAVVVGDRVALFHLGPRGQELTIAH